jgi:hypothetical protein
MDILASMFAYLGCVTGIVGTLALSFYLFFAAPNQAQTHSIAMAAKSDVFGKSDRLRIASAAQAKPDANVAHADTHVVSRVASQDASNVATTDASPATAAPKKAQLARASLLRRLVQEDRARRWAYQQDPSFETRFLGYAD